MPTNHQIAQRLQQTARELAATRANLYRVRAYRTAAHTILALDRPVETLLQEEGSQFLERYPGIGKSLCEKITRYAQTGEWVMN